MSAATNMTEVHNAIRATEGKAVDTSKAPQDLAKAQAMTQAAIAMSSGKAVDSSKAPRELAKAQDMTKAAIEGMGVIYASMTDNKIVDTGLAKAMTDVAIQKGGVKSADAAKAPVDRAITEALTLGAINSGKAAAGLKKTETKESSVDLAALQADAQAEKDAKAAARTFGGGDAKEGMGSILKEIEGQGGAISVPAGKAPESNVSLNHAKTLMEIEALKGKPIYASGTDHKVEDKALNQAKMLGEISSKGVSSVNPDKIAKVEGFAKSEAATMAAISAGKGKESLKSVEKPAEGLSQEKLAALQEEAKKEKA